jgi:2-polyprenyl-6-methoxyphenol hydroxylase-like FAD-dependent oxidoreductase
VPAEEAPALMRELLAGFSGLAGELRDRIVGPDQVVRRPVEAILVDPPWHHGRTVLIGDAVHAPPPTLAAGAAIALEDAVVLDEMLAAGGDVDAARVSSTAAPSAARSSSSTRSRDHRPDARLRRRRVRAPCVGRACQAVLVGR